MAVAVERRGQQEKRTVMKARRVSPAIVWVLLGVCPMAGARQNLEVRRIEFDSGASSATMKGSITGNETVDYQLRARAGQTMSVMLKTGNSSNYFNVLPPGSVAALANSSTSGNDWTGTLPVDGDYRIRVYLMRSAARRNETANYALTVRITGSTDAKVAGTPYHATGMVPCSVGTDPKRSAQCSFGVIRSSPGHADVYLASPGYDVTLHKDKLRVLKFAGDIVTSSDPKEKVSFEKQGDDWSISVDGFYFYVIPEAVIIGG
jgi:hypothetical protein